MCFIEWTEVPVSSSFSFFGDEKIDAQDRVCALVSSSHQNKTLWSGGMMDSV